MKGVTYYSCTYDYGWVTGNKPWCLTKTDENSKHQSGQWGVCDDYERCHIPTRCKFFVNQTSHQSWFLLSFSVYTRDVSRSKYIKY